MDVESYDVVIIGGGIAGFSAALYTARQGLKTAVITIDIGGQLSYASVIENYPGVEATSGLNLVLKVQNQAVSYGVEVYIDEVIGLEKTGQGFLVKTKKGLVFNAISVIAACGKAPKRLGIESEDNFIGRGLSYCVICDGPLYRGKDVALVSFGEKGIENIQFLASIARRVYYIVPSERDPSIEIAKGYSNVSIFSGYRVVELYGGQKLEKIVLVDKTRNRVEINVDALFVELGFETRIDFLKPFVDVNDKGEVVVDKYGRTKTEGLFAAGDLVETPYKQAVIAASSGVIAALSAINYVYSVKGLRRSIVSDWMKKQKIERGISRFRL